MSYRVVYTDRVNSHFDQHVQYLTHQHVPRHVIEGWYAPLLDAIDQLGEMPRLYAVDEFYSRRSGFEVRKLSYKKYIVRYRVDEQARAVYVLSFMHGARRPDASSTR